MSESTTKATAPRWYQKEISITVSACYVYELVQTTSHYKPCGSYLALTLIGLPCFLHRLRREGVI